MKQTTVNATRDQIEEFTKSVLWKDIRRELMQWKKGFTQELSTITDEAKETNPSTASVLLHLGDINGRTKAIDFLLSLPDVFIQILDAENKSV